MREIFAIQIFESDDVWRTIFVTTYRPDADVTFDTLPEVTTALARLVTFKVSDLDFIAIYARDFAVLSHTGA